MKGAVNNRCKVGIEYNYRLLKDGKDINQQQFLNVLKELNDNDYSSSANLSALLIYQPDPLVSAYMDTFCKENGIDDRIMYAFNKYRSSVRFTYIHESSMPGTWSYSLIKCIGFLLDNAVSVQPDKSFRIWLDEMERFISKETEFVPFDSSLCSYSYKFARCLTENLENTYPSNVLNVLKVKYLIRTNSDIEKILQYSRKVNYPFMMFVSVILSSDDISVIEDIKNKLVRLARNRKYDAYDAVYVIKDMEETWDLLKNRKPHSREFLQAVSELLQTDFININ